MTLIEQSEEIAGTLRRKAQSLRIDAEYIQHGTTWTPKELAGLLFMYAKELDEVANKIGGR